MKLFIKISLAVLFSAVIFSCNSVRSSQKLFETFFVGEDGTQFYIKPLKYESELGNYIEIDYTLRYKDEIKDTTRLNMSFNHTEVIKQIDSVKINTPNASILITEFDLMFNEKTKNGFLSRISAKSPLKDINAVFQDNNWVIDYYNNGVAESFIPTKKTKKYTTQLKDNIFVLF